MGFARKFAPRPSQDTSGVALKNVLQLQARSEKDETEILDLSSER